MKSSLPPELLGGTNWADIGERVVAKVAQRLRVKCGFDRSFIGRAELAGELGIIDADTQLEIGQELRGLRRSLVLAFEGRNTKKEGKDEKAEMEGKMGT